jgi:hypothetical protein
LSELLNNFAENNKINSATTIAELCSIEKSKITDLVKIGEDGQKDYTECIVFMNAIVVQIAEYYGVEWSDLTTRDLCKTLYFEYYALGVEGWIHFCKRLKAGYFEKNFGKLTPAMLVNYVNIYYYEWTEQHANINSSGSVAYASSFKPISEAINSLKMLENNESKS